MQTLEQRRRRPEARTRMTAGHFIFIPAVLLVGIVIGWILGVARRARRVCGGVEAARGREAKGRRKKLRIQRPLLLPSTCCLLPVTLPFTVLRQVSAPALRQSGLDNLRLRLFDRIRQAKQFDARAGGRRVDDGVRGARIAVARLSHRSGIDQILRAGFNARADSPAAAGPTVSNAVGRQLERERDSACGRTGTADASVAFERAHGVELVEDVRVLVERRAVADLDEVVDDDRSVGQRRRASRGSAASAMSSVHRAALRPRR